LPAAQGRLSSTVSLVLVTLVLLAAALPVSAQLFSPIVFDPTNYGNALARYAQLQQQYSQLVLTYQQIRTQYDLLARQAQQLPGDLSARYRSISSSWQPFSAGQTYNTTAAWISSANTGQDALGSYAQATQPLVGYGSAISALPYGQFTRTQLHYDRIQLTDAAIVHALEALGSLRAQEPSVESAVRNLENDAYASDPELNTQIAVLNKINATNVASTRLAKDTNNLLISLLEQQLLDATDRRDAAVQAVDAHIAFLNEAPALFGQTSSETTNALSTFRIP
jgi:hypothetical protein